MWDSIFRESRHNVKFTYAVSDDSSLYTGLLNAFSHLIADCSDETWVGWINDDDQLSPDVARILLSLNDTYPEISCLSGVPAIRGSQNTNILDFRLCNKLLSLGLYDGLHLPFLQQEGTFLKATIWKENLSAIRHSWQSLKYAGDYYLWSFLSRQHRFYLYSKPLGIFNMADGAAQLSQSCKNLYLSEINSILPLESRKSSFEAALESQNAHLQYTVLCPEWSVLRAKVIELPFELLGHKKFRSKSYRDLG
jgi:hypothetical protein